MRIEDIISMMRDHFLLALIAVIVLGIIVFLMFFIGNKTVLRGRKPAPKMRLLLLAAFVGYVIMVVGVTFLNRGQSYPAGVELSLFSSYREAWYRFDVRHWQFIILNILMFVPFGILLPLLHSRFKKAVWTLGAALLFTVSIESFQWVTGYGTFEADDLLNNCLGAVIGYGLVMGFISLKEKGIKRSLVYFSPLLLVVLLFGSLFAYYQSKEFGNLSIVPVHQADMEQAEITTDVTFSGNGRRVPVYQAPGYTKEQADDFVRVFFERMNVDPVEIEDLSYPGEGMYRVYAESTYHLSVQFKDGSYSLTDFSSLDEGREPEDTDEQTLRARLADLELTVPPEAEFQKADTGKYEWTVDLEASGNELTDGALAVTYYNDGTVKELENRLVTYEKFKDVQMKSEQQAYQEIVRGEFQVLSEDLHIKNLHIHDVTVDYSLDSKGYFQPVYAFHSTVDGTEMTILVPGI